MGLPQSWSVPVARRFEEHLLFVEKELRLLSMFSPHNFEEEVSRVGLALQRGHFQLPHFVYQDPPGSALRLVKVAELLQWLKFVLNSAHEADEDEHEAQLRGLFQERHEELLLELQLVQGRGDAKVVELSKERYSFTDAEIQNADVLAEKWLKGELGADDESGHGLLCSQLNRLVIESGYSIQVVEGDIASEAAIAGDALVVRRGARGSEGKARRLLFHEVEGHLLPRINARSEPPPFQIGTSACSEDEEGRALYLEERSGTLGSERRFALAVRHLLAGTIQGSGDLKGLALALVEGGASSRLVARGLCRALRGGGLCRELVYLPAYLRVRGALLAHPEDEEWMKRGRISVKAARRLSQLFG